jgi:hypothetical protein
MTKVKKRSGSSTLSVDEAHDTPPSFVKAKKEIPFDTLKNIRAGIMALHNAKLEKQDAEQRIKEINVKIFDMERKTLPDLMNMAGVPSLEIEAAGNSPALFIKKEPYYRANIAASWDSQRKDDAFRWLSENGGGDLIKTEITVRLPLRSTAMAKTVIAALRKLKVEFTVDKAVPWASLTSFLRECYERRKITPPLDKLGAEVGEIVKIREK